MALSYDGSTGTQAAPPVRKVKRPRLAWRIKSDFVALAVYAVCTLAITVLLIVIVASAE